MSTASPARADATEALAERLFAATIDALELGCIHLGRRLGLYDALAGASEALTAPALAAASGCEERYVREWLEQQATAGLLEVDDASAGPLQRRYALPAAHRPVLVDPEAPEYSAPLATLALGTLEPMEALLEAFRTGGGVPYEAYGANAREGIGDANRPMFVNELAGWLRAVPEVHDRLSAEPPARVADLACGTGWSSIAIARAYPLVHVDALDADAASIATARENVAAAGVSDRVTPSVADVSHADWRGRFDVVTVFEALHDMNHPVEALRAARDSLAPRGCVIVGDEKVAETFQAPGDELERLNYGFSVLHCLAVGSTEPGAARTGTVIRPETVRAYARDAGFGSVEVLGVENDLWRFYRLTP